MNSDRPPNPYAEPSQATQPEPPPRAARSKRAGTAQRIAGGLMMLNGALVLLEAALAPHAAPGAVSAATATGIVPAILDIAIGIALLSGNGVLVMFAIVRTVLGMTVGTALRLQEGPGVMIYQVALCGSLLGLLVGEAGRLRMAIAGSAMGACLLLEIVGLAGLATGSNPLAVAAAVLSGDIESAPVERVTGRTAPYELSFPNRGWYERKPAVVLRDNALADRWFVRPDKDAHILVVAEAAPEAALPIEAYIDAVFEGMKQDSPTLDVRSREPWPTFGERGRLVQASDRKTGAVIERRYAFVTMFGRAYYLVGLASKETMPSVEQEMRAVFDSLKLPESVLNALPSDVDPAPITRVVGDKMAYSILAPSPRWHVRKPEIVKRDNALIDRWLTQSEMNAHVLVIAEQAENDNVILLPLYVEAILASAKKGSTRFEILSQGPWAKFPKNGARVRLSLAREGSELEYDYGLYARGPRAFQVIGFSSKNAFSGAAAELGRAIDSFEPPP